MMTARRERPPDRNRRPKGISKLSSSTKYNALPKIKQISGLTPIGAVVPVVLETITRAYCAQPSS